VPKDLTLEDLIPDEVRNDLEAEFFKSFNGFVESAKKVWSIFEVKYQMIVHNIGSSAFINLWDGLPREQWEGAAKAEMTREAVEILDGVCQDFMQATLPAAIHFQDMKALIKILLKRDKMIHDDAMVNEFLLSSHPQDSAAAVERERFLKIQLEETAEYSNMVSEMSEWVMKFEPSYSRRTCVKKTREFTAAFRQWQQEWKASQYPLVLL